jgi:hypothetical protein
MSTNTQDEIAPAYIRNKLITLALDESSTVVRAFQPAVLNIDYSACAPGGVMLPLLVEIQGPSPESYQRRVFAHVAPGSVVLSAREGGRHLITVSEVAHNRWFGSLQVDVLGDPLRPLRVV